MKNKFLIALGASAGGQAALSEFFDHTLPAHASYVITTHLYPYQKSFLAALLQKHSAMRVCDVENEVLIEPNVVYVMPENKVMAIKDGKLMLIQRDLSIRLNMAVDIFFKSLAEDTLFQKIAIILSGMGVDGTEGIRALAQKGGYIIAQAPASADESGMPDSVIASGLANQILAPRHMPEAIIAYMDRCD